MPKKRYMEEPYDPTRVNRRLVDDVARMLSQPCATHPNFIAEVTENMRRRGYQLRGMCVEIVKGYVPPKG